MKVKPIICHQCGQDYAREYWAMPTNSDPFVCRSCRRDLNPDAADAPRGGPPPAVNPTVRPIIVTKTRKQCRMCRGEWDGLIFGSSATKGSPLPFGICPRCAIAENLRTAPIVPMGMPLPELARPRRVTVDD